MEGRTNAHLVRGYGEQLKALCGEVSDKMEMLVQWLRTQDSTVSPETQTLIQELVEVQTQLRTAGEILVQRTTHVVGTAHPRKARTKAAVKTAVGSMLAACSHVHVFG